MMAHILGTYPPGTPEWHAARHGRIGGSSIAAAMGWSPYETPDQLAARMAGTLDPKPTSRAMARGNYLEAGIADWLADDKGLTYDPDASAATWAHDLYRWAIYNPDRITTDGALVEIKTTHDRSEENGWGRAGTDRIPLYYAAQVQWGMGILDLPFCWVAVLAGAINGRPSLDMAVYRVPADPDAFAFLFARAQRFHDTLTERPAA